SINLFKTRSRIWNCSVNIKIQSILVEGGAETLRMFIDRGLWDEARIFTSHRSFEKGIAAPLLRGHLMSEQDVMGDRLFIYARQLIKN
ncbi:MAG: hypothetical protein K2U26_11025, partial [Cyclobacteriaceae bacterium]|nr:hypothetical protein [Cyclobacteriaceae bacterium]